MRFNRRAADRGEEEVEGFIDSQLSVLVQPLPKTFRPVHEVKRTAAG